MEHNQLAHYGVKGMRWGVKRNPDRVKGARREKLKRTINGVSAKEGRRQASKLSNEELTQRISRIEKEKRYAELVKQPGLLAKSHNLAKNILAVGGTATAVYALAKSPMVKSIATTVKKAMDS